MCQRNFLGIVLVYVAARGALFVEVFVGLRSAHGRAGNLLTGQAAGLPGELAGEPGQSAGQRALPG